MKSSKEMADAVFMIRDEYLEKKRNRDMAVRKAVYIGSPVCIISLIVAGAVFFGNNTAYVPPVSYPSEVVSDTDTFSVSDTDADNSYSNSYSYSSINSTSSNSSNTDSDSNTTSSRQNTSSNNTSSSQRNNKSSDTDTSKTRNSDTDTSKTRSSDTDTSKTRNSDTDTSKTRNSDTDTSVSHPASTDISTSTDTSTTTDTTVPPDSERPIPDAPDSDYSPSTNGSTDTGTSTDEWGGSPEDDPIDPPEYIFWDNETFYKEIPTLTYNGKKYECNNTFVSIDEINEYLDIIYFEDFADFSIVGNIFTIYGIDESEYIALYLPERLDYEECIVYKPVED